MEEERFCPNCGKDTMQASALYNPDYPDLGLVWQCLDCLECIDFINE